MTRLPRRCHTWARLDMSVWLLPKKCTCGFLIIVYWLHSTISPAELRPKCSNKGEKTHHKAKFWFCLCTGRQLPPPPSTLAETSLAVVVKRTHMFRCVLRWRCSLQPSLDCEGRPQGQEPLGPLLSPLLFAFGIHLSVLCRWFLGCHSLCWSADPVHSPRCNRCLV